MLENIYKYGYITPSSRFLAKKMSSTIPIDGEGRKILEIGAGEGAITDFIIQQMNDTDKLYIVEIDPDMVKKIQHKYKENKNIIIIQSDILNFNETGFNYIICSLPFNSFHKEHNIKIINKIKDLANKDSVFCFFEYLFINQIKKGFKEIRSDLTNKYLYKTKNVILNIPPAKIYFINL